MYWISNAGEKEFYLKAIVNQTMAMNNPWSLSLGAASDIKFFITFKNTLSVKSLQGLIAGMWEVLI